MNLLISGVRASVKAYPQFSPPPSMDPPSWTIVVVQLRCKEVPEFYKDLVAHFENEYGEVASGELTNGLIQFRVGGVDTELEAIELMQSAGFDVKQRPAY